MCFYRQCIIFIFFLSLTACAVGPNYKRPRAFPMIGMPTHFKEAGRNTTYTIKTVKWKIACPQDLTYKESWWLIFHDHTLTHLEDELNVSNQSIINAYQNYRQARALVDEARAAYFPTVSSSLTVTRQKQSGGSTSFLSTSTTGAANTGTASGGVGSSTVFNSHSLGLSASWVPDLWGQVRRTVEASSAAAQTSAALFAATRLAQQASLAQYYFELRGLDTDQKLLNDTVRGYQKTLKITQYQYRAGTANRADIVQAVAQLENAKALAVNNGILRGQYEHAIAVLIGLPPEKFSIKFYPLTARSPRIPIEVPSTLLERRPDIAQAERTMAQNNAEIGEAEAAFFPTLTLSGVITAAARSAGLASLFSLSGISWAYGPQLTEVFFNGGLRIATLAAAKYGYYASVAAYRQTVLAAFQNVEDNLVSVRLLANQAILQNAAAADARLALKLVINQYKSGTVPYSSVITAQINAFTAEKSAADINYQRMAGAVSLIAALGGGWDVSSLAQAG